MTQVGPGRTAAYKGAEDDDSSRPQHECGRCSSGSVSIRAKLHFGANADRTLSRAWEKNSSAQRLSGYESSSGDNDLASRNKSLSRLGAGGKETVVADPANVLQFSPRD
jgi:hypothetical protein